MKWLPNHLIGCGFLKNVTQARGESMSWGSMQVWGFGPMERLRESNEEINFFSPLLQKNNLRWNAMTFHLH